jgi:hypothetical protein
VIAISELRRHSGESRLFGTGSRIAVAVAANRNSGTCPDLSTLGLKFRLQRGSDAPKTIDVSYREKCKLLLDANLTDYLDSTVTLSVEYDLPAPTVLSGKNAESDNSSLVVYTTSFDVRHLGLITSFPVVSEVVSAFQKGTKDDIMAVSSIPLSYAIKLSGNSAGHHVAVSIPWKLGYNPRWAPDLARYLSVYLAASAIFSDDKTTDPEWGLGVGVNLAEVGFISWSATTSGDRYVLLGLDVKDIAGLWKL